MAFFGLTFLGLQNPFRDKKISIPKYELPVGSIPPKLELFYPKLPPIGVFGYDDDTVHRGSHEKYHSAVRQKRLKKYPNQEYRVPLTCAQEIGWWQPKNLSINVEDSLPWIKASRHPQIRSPMSRFVDYMAVIDPLFSLF
ncbi:sperm microtubule inner protein 11 [Erythrolamprus reginae]|uniref:sperm microtubule inner protein 11 n=1 Tax=Erythrolamprus reginae TaxID=121349 RepID=UPI00396C8231